jgi:hypothetical protein
VTSAALHLEVVLAVAYAGFLLLAAGGMEVVGRLSHRRVARLKTAGFRYDATLRAWRCSQQHALWLRAIDASRRIAHYQADGRICNVCASKPACTDSDEGRVLYRPLDEWPQTDMARFHRAVSATLFVLAFFVLAVVAVRHGAHEELWLLGPSTGVALGAAGRSVTGLWRLARPSSVALKPPPVSRAPASRRGADVRH